MQKIKYLHTLISITWFPSRLRTAKIAHQEKLRSSIYSFSEIPPMLCLFHLYYSQLGNKHNKYSHLNSSKALLNLFRIARFLTLILLNSTFCNSCNGFIHTGKHSNLTNSCKSTRAIPARFSTPQRLHNFDLKHTTASHPTIWCC